MTQAPDHNPDLRVLLVEDDEDDFVLFSRILGKALGPRHELTWVRDASMALARTSDHDVVFLDYRLGGGLSGLDVLRELTQKKVKAPVILLTGQAEREVDLEAMRLGAADFIAKGEITDRLLERSIRYSIERKRSQAELSRHKEELERLVEERTRELKASEALYRAVVQDQTEFICRFNPEGRLTFANEALCRHLGQSCEMVLSKNVLHPCLESEELAADLRPQLVALTPASPVTELDCQADCPTGPCWHHWTFRAIFEGSELTTYQAVGRDITERVRDEASLVAAREAAEAANKAKSEFLANMSHEIRTPMNGIMGMTELALLVPDLPKEARDYLEYVRQSGRALLDIVNDILDIAKIEAGKTRLQIMELDLRQVIEQAMRPLSVIAQDKGLAMRWTLAPDVPERLAGDQGRIRQILTNIVGNAIKFTEQGHVLVMVSLDRSETDEKHGIPLLFEISDTGIGIPKDKLTSIFDSFTQALGSAHAKYGGTGLGLAITRSLVEMMDGRIWVESEPGLGSVFRFVIRLAAPSHPSGPAPAARKTAQPEGGALTVLVAEDNQVNKLLAKRLLEQMGHRVEEADTGRQALDKLRSGGIDLVLMDVRMPEMDGVETTRIIRSGQASGVSQDIPIVALTAYALKGDRERLLDSGMDDYLSKPIDRLELQEVLNRLIKPR